MMREPFEFDLSRTALAFRGYNITNLGRSRELLEHPLYGPLLEHELLRGAELCADVLHRPVDLRRRVRESHEPALHDYAEAVALIMSIELAQVRILRELFSVDLDATQLMLGYSLGEVAALVVTGVLDVEDVLPVLLELAPDCAALAEGVRLGVLFSRGPALSEDAVNLLCEQINEEGRGIIGVSAVLSPNSMLLMGQGRTLSMFRRRMREVLEPPVFLRRSQSPWPPLHTPIVWQSNVPNRAAHRMHTMPVRRQAPQPAIISLITGRASYLDNNLRQHLNRWTDHPQRLWDAIYETLAAGVETILHIGPQPNIIPATFRRLSQNVADQTGPASRALSHALRPWLLNLLPDRVALLRAPHVQHVILEDWLLDVGTPQRGCDASAACPVRG